MNVFYPYTTRDMYVCVCALIISMQLLCGYLRILSRKLNCMKTCRPIPIRFHGEKKSCESCLSMSEVSSLFSCSLLPFSILKHLRLPQSIQPATSRFMDFFPQKNMAPQACRMCITWGKGSMPRKPLSWNEWTKRMIKFRFPYFCPSIYLFVWRAISLLFSVSLQTSFHLSCSLVV